MEKLTQKQMKWLISMLKAHVNNLGGNEEAMKDIKISNEIRWVLENFTQG